MPSIIQTKTQFNDLPNEIILIICKYLTPAQVLELFLCYNERLYNCISDYHKKIDLTYWSYSELRIFRDLYKRNKLQPSEIIVSNEQINSQIDLFFKTCRSSSKNSLIKIQHLSLNSCSERNFSWNYSFLKDSTALKSLDIIESKSDTGRGTAKYNSNQDFYDYIFNNSTKSLVKLNHYTIHGIILSKQLPSNHYLTNLTISLHDISDVYVLLDGLIPNLKFLSVIICYSTAYQQIVIPDTWPDKMMSYLHEFQLQIERNANVTFEQLRHVFMPLSQLNKLKLDIKQWIDKNQNFEMLIEQYLPNIQQFFCSIMIMTSLDMKSFEMLKQRWPITYSSDLSNHIYTIPWAFANLTTSRLAENDTISICPDVVYLKVDTCKSLNLSDQFPMTNTLMIESKCNLSSKHYYGFRRLRHLIIPHLNMVPSSLLRRIHTLTLTETMNLLNHSISYPNVRRLIIEKDSINSSETIKIITKHFPNLHSIETKLESNEDYYDNLNMFFNRKYFPNLIFLKISVNDELRYRSNIQTCITFKTSLKWSLVPFYVDSDRDNLFISY